MDEDHPRAEQPTSSGAAEPGAGPAGRAEGPERYPAGAEGQALAHEADEIRRLVDAGAGSPEELRVLAARIRDHRSREEALWRSQVKPGLKKIRRGAPPPPAPGPPSGDALDLPPLPAELAMPLEAPPTNVGRGLAVAVALVVLLVVLIAASSSVLWVVLPVAGLLGYAWWQGRSASRGG